MATDPEELPVRKKITAIAPGEDLSTLSEHELAARIQIMEAEIARAREAIAARRATRDAAAAMFRR